MPEDTSGVNIESNERDSTTQKSEPHMKRNAFTSDRHGVVTNYEPEFSGDTETETFQHWLKHDTSQQGGTICLSSIITLDALISLHQVITGEMTARAVSQLENTP